MIAIVSLLFITDDNENNFINISQKNSDIYIDMLNYRCQQLKRLDVEHIIMCDKSTAASLEDDGHFQIVIVEDITSVSPDVPFKNAYNKLNICHVFEHTTVERLVFLDLDIFIDEKRFNSTSFRLQRTQGVIWYDISSEMQTAIHDNYFLYEDYPKERKVWAGGEIFSVDRQNSSNFINILEETFIEHEAWYSSQIIKNFGDELIISRLVMKKAIPLSNTFGSIDIKRFWTIPVKHRRAFSDIFPIYNYTFYHLPSEKIIFRLLNRLKIKAPLFIKVYITLKILNPVNIVKILR